MRVVCLHPARDPFLHSACVLRIGSAADNDLVVAGGDAHHVQVTLDQRGLVLDVHPGCQRVYVNARPVRERALLRLGDTLTVGAQKFMLTADVEPTADFPDAGATPGPLALRVVTGSSSGQSLPVSPELRLGLGSRHFGELAYGCRITRVPGGLAFHSDSASPRINGWHCQAARLHPGDQVSLGEHRLVVDAPGLEYAEHLAALPVPQPPVEAEEPRDDSPQTGVWWLIAAAIVLAAVIAALLYVRW